MNDLSDHDSPNAANAQAFAEALEGALTSGAVVQLDTSGWDETDITTVNVLLSAFVTSQARDATLQVSVPEEGHLAGTLARAGLVPEAHLIFDAEQWTGLNDPALDNTCGDPT